MADYRDAGPHAVVIDEGEWHDTGRARTLRWRRYRPHAADGVPAFAPAARGPLVARAPLVLHSHGLGGSSGSGAAWLSHWASWGIAGVAVQHPGSDVDACLSDSPLALRQLLRTAADTAQLAARQHDLLFALDRVAGAPKEVPLGGAPKAVAWGDGAPPAIGLSGHSFGAVGALRVLGERRGCDDRPADPRVAAAILFSPSARGGTLPLAERFAGVAPPCLHLTGSRDDGIGPGDIAAADRCLPFAHMPSAGQLLLVLAGATHPEFAGDAGGAVPAAAVDRRHLLQAATTAFWRHRLLADAAAADWLHGTLPQLLAHDDRLQRK